MALTYIFTLFKNWRKYKQDKLAIEKLNAIANYLTAYGFQNGEISKKAEDIIKSF